MVSLPPDAARLYEEIKAITNGELDPDTLNQDRDPEFESRLNDPTLDYNDPQVFSKLFGPDSHLPIPAYQSPEDVRKEANE